MARRTMPGWLATTLWVVLGVAAVGLPVALVTAGLDAVRRDGSVVAQRTTLAALVLLGVVLVVAVERGVALAAREVSVGVAAAGAGVVAGLVLLGVLLPGVGLVLAAVGVVLGLVAAFAGVGWLAWWRWRHGPRPAPRTPPTTEDVRARAEGRRVRVRARHDRTREAVRRGYIGPGYTRGR